MGTKPKETELYGPVKALLEAQGYEVKAEIGAADVVAVRGDEPPVIVELKTGFSLTLIHQAIDRLKITDSVYVAVPEWSGRAGWKAFRQNQTLCRRLGLGVITVNLKSNTAQVQLDPKPYTPRKSKVKQTRMLGEFQKRVGDPNVGGMTKVKRITSYRQDALRCLYLLNKQGAMRPKDVALETEVTRARTIMADDHYGWFERVERGIYAITPKGVEAVADYSDELENLVR